jgi:hypothetical protein
VDSTEEAERLGRSITGAHVDSALGDWTLMAVAQARDDVINLRSTVRKPTSELIVKR